MKLVFICSQYPPGPHGGIGTFTQVLARALVGAGHEVRVLGIYRPGYPADDYEVDRGVRVWRLRASPQRWGWISDRYRLFRRVAQWCRNDQIDLVEVPDWEGWAAGWRRLPIPVVTRLHGSACYLAAELNRPVRRTTYLLERSSIHRSDYWCSVSRYAAEKTRHVFGLRDGPHAILYNPVETLAQDDDGTRIADRVVFTGTLTRNKGIVSLLQAWPYVLKRWPRAQLHVFGKDGRSPQGESMQAFLEAQMDAATHNSVRFFGHVPRERIFEALRAARVAVFPSYAETFPIAPLEAMACRCTTICSRRGPGPELIEDGRNGLLVDPDQPGQIAQTIHQVLANRHLAYRLAEAGYQQIQERFSLATLLPHNETFYRKCIQGHHALREGTSPCSSV